MGVGGQPQVPAALTPKNHPGTDCTELLCTVRTCNSSHAAGVGAPYGREYLYGTIHLKPPSSWAAVGI
jgi:hypothetical protein